jgi:hypothetical protein
VCTARNQLRLTLTADKSVFETIDQVAKLEHLVREEFVQLLQGKGR